MEKAIIEQYRDIIRETQDLEHRVRKLKGKLDQRELDENARRLSD